MTIDWWTLGFQTVNGLILIWLLQRFFWKPVAAVIAARGDAARQAATQAGASRDKAAEAMAGIEHTRAGLAEERAKILAAAQAEAEKAHAARVQKAGEEAAAIEAAAKARIETERQAARKAWIDMSSRLSVDIAGRLAARLSGPAVRAAFLDWALAAIKALPQSTRDAMAAEPLALEAVSATALDPAEQEHTRSLIGTAFGTHPSLAFRTEPKLIAGLELHSPHLIIGNSWRADLAVILADLAHDP